MSLAAVLVGLGICGLSTSFGQVLVTPVVTLNAGVYTYSYSVVNSAPNDLAIVSFAAMPAGVLTVQNRTAPTGFLLTYDSGNGFISFAEDNNPNTPQTFASGSTVSPFTFTSTFAPGATSFQALDIFGNTYTGVTQAPIPEPSALALCALALPALGLLFYRRRKLQTPFVLA